MTTAGPRPAFWPSVGRWAASIANSWAHFIPLAIVAPFSRRAAIAIHRRWVARTYRIAGIRPVLHDRSGLPRETPGVLYIWLDQTSLAEAGLFAMFLPEHRGIINVEFAAMPLLGWAHVLMRHKIIVRQWKRQAKRGIERAAERLGRGERWMISIEGARSPDGRLQPYKKGPIVMALRAQATIVPVLTKGGHRVLPKGEWRPRPGTIELHLLPAIPTRGLTYDDRDKLVEQLRALAEAELSH